MPRTMIVARLGHCISRGILQHDTQVLCQRFRQYQYMTAASSIEWRPKCQSCFLLQQTNLHTSSSCMVARAKNTKKKLTKPVHFKPKTQVVSIRHDMSVRDLATTLEKNTDHVFEAMLYIKNTDKYDSEDSVIDDLNVIKEIVKKSGLKFKMEEKKKKVEKENKDGFKRPPADPAHMTRRPPVVTIMGHVDHGKTTLLDALRQSHVVDTEFGGITQHIGAFSVPLDSGETITFLDTPGHAAFSAMRARGAHVTDIVVLVVAADDGVMKQTKESAQMALQEGVPIIVAINKIDKPESDVEATKRGLLGLELIVEELGGDIQAVPVSALKGTNVDALQEAIATLAEVLEIKAEPTGLVEGAVIESKTDAGRGKLSTALIQRGTLRKGCVLVAGTAWAKVRGMFNDQGRPVQEAGPGDAVEVIGWRDLPSAGDEILEVESEPRAREVTHWRQEQAKLNRQSQDAAIINLKVEEHNKEYHAKRNAVLEKGRRRTALYRRERVKEVRETHTGPELAVVVKGDVDGTLEAILDVLDTYHSDQCRLHLLHYGVGDITEHDLNIAAAFSGIVYGFNVNITGPAGKLAQAKGITIEKHNVIYKMFDSIREQLTLRLPPSMQEETIGEANVQQLFMITDGKKKVPVAGCRCTKGMLQRKKHFKLVRGGEEILNGSLASLKHFKNEVESIKTDVECGIAFTDRSVEPQPGDQILCYEIKEVREEIDWDLEF